MAETEVGGGAEDNNIARMSTDALAVASMTRKDRRMAAKKGKRKKKRQEIAEVARMEEEKRLNDPEEQLRLQAEEEMEKQRVEKARVEFEEGERRIWEEWGRRRAEAERISAEEEEEEESLRKQNQNECEEKSVDECDWEYVEEGPPEIIWQGNEIIVKKKKIKLKKEDASRLRIKEDPNRPTSNPFPPQSESLYDSIGGSVLSAQELIDNVAQEIPNFGTEQDKAHCPFHLKIGACRFGTRCSRIHFYPDKSCTLLIKNMYSGPGLAWEQDEGLEHTDEEVEQAYEEFYEDVHTEFLKFGEIVNFKVCRNGLSHLRGNVYVHYKSLDSAVAAFQFMNGRYFAGKQVLCEFVGITRWKVAICGEFMKSKLQTCSRGISCNFIHPFRNPGGDYEWADWDKPPPRHWQHEITVLFGTPDVQGSPGNSRALTDDDKRHCSHRSRSRENHTIRASPECISDSRRCNTSSHHKRNHSDGHYYRQRNAKSRWRDELEHHSRSPSTEKGSEVELLTKDTGERSRKHKVHETGVKNVDHRDDSHENGKHLHTRNRSSDKKYEMVDRSQRANEKGFKAVNKNRGDRTSEQRNDRRSRSYDKNLTDELKRKPDVDQSYETKFRRQRTRHSKRSKKSHRDTDVYNVEVMTDRWEPII